MTRFDDESSSQENNNPTNCDNPSIEEPNQTTAQTVLETLPEPTPTPPIPAESTPDPANVDADEGQNLCSTVLSESTPVSSSDLTVNFPLKERNFSTKSRESTSFDPREPLPRNLSADNEKENLKSDDSNDNTIQCNEVSSSNIEVDSTSNDEEHVTNRSITFVFPERILRSGKKGKNEEPVPLKSRIMTAEEEEKSKISKRKLEQEQSLSQPRKSLRIDSNQKKAEEIVEKERKAFEAEEKLKRLAEKADLAKSNSTTVTPKPSLAQKIANTKLVTIKKKSRILNKPITKKKIQIGLKKVKKSAVLKTRINPKIDDKKKGKGSVTSKSSEILYKKNSNKDISQSQRHIHLANKTGSQMDNKVIDKTKEKTVEVKNKERVRGKKIKEPVAIKDRSETKKVAVASSLISSEPQTIKKSTRNSSIIPKPLKDTVSPMGKSTTTKVMPKIEETMKTKTLSIRLQQKTESLRKNVTRKK